ncbi:hypothetical protein BOTBODRAFT_35643 [Botryobasidium botryosum FD-172 SS1]|uniref:Septation initiation network scaffold protein cdc11 n=1 Tax=Botryobasidium botryosum (strain FD-172 SS1) TaxID=930990 RepID=A0A067M5P6_BOTB1|nr:hypothetical protein BOTBODRAFT_35643 [Botryobasidium botryosum FD-172 SS1]
MAQPAWLTGDLEEEWVELDQSQPNSPTPSSVRDSQSHNSFRPQSVSNSLHSPNAPTQFAGERDAEPDSPKAGTFLIREDVPAVPVHIPKTPGKKRGARSAGIKDFFSPLALETMFEPPSPPRADPSASGSRVIRPSGLRQVLTADESGASISMSDRNSVRGGLDSEHGGIDRVGKNTRGEFQVQEGEGAEEGDRPDEILATDIPNLAIFDGRAPSDSYQFTFRPPPVPASPPPSTTTRPLLPPGTDPRLRLFQFQYDTYTRDHLSALVDSIAAVDIDSPSGPPSRSRSVETGFGLGLSVGPGGEQVWRSTKRIRLSPEDESFDFNTGGGGRGGQRDEGEGDEEEGEGGEGEERAGIASPGMLEVPPPSRAASGRDYLGEARCLMENIKQSRSLSFSSQSEPSLETHAVDGGTINERQRRVVSALHSGFPSPPDASSTPVATGPFSGVRGPASSMAWRQQAAGIMSQLKADRRLFSWGTERSSANGGDASSRADPDPEQGISPLAQIPESAVHQEQETPKKTAATGVSAPAREWEARLKSASKDMGPSPRKLLRRISAADEVDREILEEGLSMGSSVADSSPSKGESNDREKGKGREEEGEGSAMIPQPRYLQYIPPPPEPHRLPGNSSLAPAAALAPSIRVAPPSPAPPPLGAGHSASVSAPAPTSASVAVSSSGSRVSSPRPLAGPANGQMQADLSRFVSSSTVPGSPLTRASTVASYTKHEPSPLAPPLQLPAHLMPAAHPHPNAVAGLTAGIGMGAGGGVGVGAPHGVRLIAPQDVGEIERAGRMVFDKVEMRWKRIALGREGDITSSSEDPFKDFESLVEGDSEEIEHPDQGQDAQDGDGDGGEEEGREERGGEEGGFDRGDEGGEEDMDLEKRDSVDEGESDHEREDEEVERRSTAKASAPRFAVPDSPEPPSRVAPYTPRANHTGPSTHRRATPFPARSALKSSQTPSLADSTAPANGTFRGTGRHKAHRRSVSFSDGRLSGPIRGLEGASLSMGAEDSVETADAETVEDGDEEEDGGDGVGDVSMATSVRTGRILGMLEGLEDSGYEGAANDHQGRHPSDGAPPRPDSQLSQTAVSTESSLRPPSQFRRSVVRSSTPTGGAETTTNTNKTFLTECSFGVAHDRLVTLITDVQPYVPYWEDLTSMDLSGKGIDSVARLKEFLPKLDRLDVNSNQLAWLSGVPGTVRTLSAASNQLTALTAYTHLINLEFLDISNNDIDSVHQLACLRHLRELRAEKNAITSVEGLTQLDGLVKVCLKGNRIQEVDFARNAWTRLESLDLSHNGLRSITGISTLTALVVLNLDNNQLEHFAAESPMPKMRILRLSMNRLTRLNAAPFTNLRTLYADNNALGEVLKAERMTKLENLSLRNQTGKGLKLAIRDVRDVKRLYLSGNPLEVNFLQEPCYNMIYLELAACRLSTLPANFSTLVPNMRVLNLNYNFLTDVRPLEGLVRLKKMTIIGSRLKGTKTLLRALQKMPDMEMLDFRMNPCTLGWYLPLLVKDASGALQPSESAPVGAEGGEGGESGAEGGEKRERGRGGEATWQDLDAKFRRDLPDESYIGRLAYRGLVMCACPRIRTLDGVVVGKPEREKAEKLLRGIASAGSTSGH